MGWWYINLLFIRSNIRYLLYNLWFYCDERSSYIRIIIKIPIQTFKCLNLLKKHLTLFTLNAARFKFELHSMFKLWYMRIFFPEICTVWTIHLIGHWRTRLGLSDDRTNRSGIPFLPAFCRGAKWGENCIFETLNNALRSFVIFNIDIAKLELQTRVSWLYCHLPHFIPSLIFFSCIWDVNWSFYRAAPFFLSSLVRRNEAPLCRFRSWVGPAAMNSLPLDEAV